VGAWGGALDEVPFHLFGVKEKDHVPMLVSAHGALERASAPKQRELKTGQMVNARCPGAAGNHRECCHSVDDHKNNRHQPVSLEETWATHWWPDRAFVFLLAVTEANAKMASENLLGRAKVGMLEFQKQLAHELIHDEHFEAESSREQQRESPRHKGRTMQHEKVVVPVHQKFRRSELAPSGTKCNQTKCAGCKKRVRMHCKCSPGITRCDECHTDHVVVEENRAEGRP
jgi:hypothetical protein